MPQQGRWVVEDTEPEKPASRWKVEDAPAPPEGPTVRGFLKNTAKSAGRFAGDIAGALTSPIQTGKALYGLGAGAVQALIPGEQGSEKNLEPLVSLYKERYGNADKLLQTMYEDPVGIAADVATFAGGAGAAAKLARLPKLAKGLGAVSTAADPLRAAGRTV